MKRIITLIILVVSLLLAIIIDKGVAGLVAFWNVPSLIIILAIPFTILILSGNMSDFIRGFKIAITSKPYDIKELKASMNAYELGIKLVILGAIYGTITGLINMLGSLDDPAAIGPAIAISFITIFYSIIINIFLYGIKARIKRELIYKK